MAINVNTVYQTVLSILNKEQRGYMTPDEFNKVATQVQLEIFESYFNDLNQQLRVPQTNVEYADRQKNVDECLAIFKQFGNTFITPAGRVLTVTVTNGGTGYSNGTNVTTSGGDGSGLTVNTTTAGGVIQSVTIANGGSGYSATNTVTITSGTTDATLTINSVNPDLYFSVPNDLYKLGTVIYNNAVELQKVNRNEYLYLNASLLTKPTTDFPVYIYERATQGTAGNNTSSPHLYIYPSSIASANDIKVSYIRKPSDIVWGFSIGGLGQYLYSSNVSTQFELIESEQTNIILRILAYAGIIIKDPQIVQVAAQAVQSEQINSKS
jgi:hypothetical protein